MLERQTPHLEFLDGLRGFASLWVLVGHAMFLTGYKIGIIAQPDLAVELFIIISGFLMAWQLPDREAASRGMHPRLEDLLDPALFPHRAPLLHLLAAALLMGPGLWENRLAIGAALGNPMSETGLYIHRYLDRSLTNILMHVTFFSA